MYMYTYISCMHIAPRELPMFILGGLVTGLAVPQPLRGGLLGFVDLVKYEGADHFLRLHATVERLGKEQGRYFAPLP